MNQDQQAFGTISESDQEKAELSLREKNDPDQLKSFYSPKRRKLIITPPADLSPGLRLRRERYLRRLTLEKMSVLLGISSSYLGAVERGTRAISAHLQARIHETLGISYDFLLDGVSVNSAVISQYVRENSGYSDDYNMKRLWNICTDDEKHLAYEISHIVLEQNRRKKSGLTAGKTTPKE